MSLYNETDGVLVVDDWNNVSVFKFRKKKKSYRRQIRFILMILAATVGSLLASGCVANAASGQPAQPKEDGFTLPTGMYVPFEKVVWCHGIICNKGASCVHSEHSRSCVMRIPFKRGDKVVLSEKNESVIAGSAFYRVSFENERFMGLLYKEKQEWLFVRFPERRELPFGVQRIKGTDKLYLMFARPPNISFSLKDKIFRSEESQHERILDPFADEL